MHNYAWYEIVGMCALTGVIIIIVWEGLNWALDRWAVRKIQKNLDELNRTAEPVVEGFQNMAEKAADISKALSKLGFPKRNDGA